MNEIPRSMPFFEAYPIYLFSALSALVLGGLNSWYWYTQGYRGGKLFFLGTIAFFSVILILIKVFIP